MHSAEHLLNGEMARRFGCGRAFSAHIERKKSKLDYHLPKPLTDEEIRSLEDYVNSAIDADATVWDEFITQAEAMDRFDMSRLPEGASETVRVVHIGDYDQCLCAGAHVAHTRDTLQCGDNVDIGIVGEEHVIVTAVLSRQREHDDV